jgi:hypothetical protein
MNAVTEFANLSLAEVSPGMLSGAAFDRSKLGPSAVNPVLCTPTVVATPEIIEGFVQLCVAAAEVYHATQALTHS